MNSKSTNINLFAQWKVAKNERWFKTRSPHPNQDYFHASNPLPKCSNRSCFLPDDCTIEEIENYLKEQIAILRFNNQAFTLKQVETTLKTNLFHWHGNLVLKQDPYIIKKLLPILVNEVFTMDNYKSLIDFEYSRHWYSDEIEKLPANEKGAKWGVKSKTKCKVRTKFYADAVREDIAEISFMYQEDNYGIFPTLQYLSKSSVYSQYQIRTYAKDYFINKSEYTKQLVKHYLKLYPDLSHEELARKVNIPERTIGRYSKIIP